MQCEPLDTAGADSDASVWQHLANRADYQILLEQARRIWDVHQQGLQTEGYRPPRAGEAHP